MLFHCFLIKVCLLVAMLKNYFLLALLILFNCNAFSQTTRKHDYWYVGTGFSFINEPQLKTGVGFNTGISVQAMPKLNGIVNIEYMFAADITPDDLSIYPRTFYNPNKNLSYVRIDAGLERLILKVNHLDFALSTALALRKRNEAFASVFYKQFPLEQSPQLVSETNYNSKWQVGNTTSIKARLNFKKTFLGIQGSYQLFSTHSFISTGLFIGINIY